MCSLVVTSFTEKSEMLVHAQSVCTRLSFPPTKDSLGSRLWRYEPKRTQIPRTEFSSKHDETLLNMLHAEIRILAVYANTWRHPQSQWAQRPPKCLNQLERAWTRAEVEKTSVSKAHWYTEWKKQLATFLWTAAMLACLPATMVTALYHECPM